MDPLVFSIIVIAIVFGTISSIAKSSQRQKAKSQHALSEEDTQLMQDLHKSLSKMEKRVEALETLLLSKK